MVKYSQAALDRTFGALADPTRRAILARLAQGEASVSELARPFPVSLPAVLKHLGVLERAGLCTQRKDGRVRRCRLQPRPLRDATEWMHFYQEFWERQFDALERYLEKAKGEDRWPRHPKQARQLWNSGARSRRRAKKSSKRGPTRS